MPVNSGNWAGVPDPVREYVGAVLQSDTPLMLLQVGSTARGYSLPDADYDFMAFFGDERDSSSVHNSVAGTPVTIDQNSLARFCEDAADYRFNLGSLRQLHKVRDGIHRIQPASGTEQLLSMAHSAHLDRNVLLAQCARIAQQAEGVLTWPGEAQHQQLISWTELLATLAVVSRPGLEAYSKPKWLHRTLERAGQTAALLAIERLYAADEAAARLLLRVLEEHWVLEFETVTSGRHRKFLSAALADARSAVEHFPRWSFTQLRFAAGQLHRLARQEDPVAILAAGAQIPAPIATAMRCGAVVTADAAWATFREVYASIAPGVAAAARQDWVTGIGSRRFYTHLLAFYDAADLTPHAAEDRVITMANGIANFLSQSGTTRGRLVSEGTS
jgi:hypothetical protein